MKKSGDKRERKKAVRVEVIKKDLNGFTGTAWLLKKGRRYFVASGTHAMFSGWEVLVFRSDKNGEITSWSDVCGGKGISMNEAIEQLQELA